MSIFSSPEEHAANPPETWTIEKRGRRWHLCARGYSLDSFDTKKKAEAAKTSGFHANLYDKEKRWYAGESVDGWKPYRVCLEERLRTHRLSRPQIFGTDAQEEFLRDEIAKVTG